MFPGDNQLPVLPEMPLCIMGLFFFLTGCMVAIEKGKAIHPEKGAIIC